MLALDFGRRGRAWPSRTRPATVARPLCVVERAASGAGLAELARLIGEEEAERVVVGMPLTLKGERGEQARETEAFVDRAGRRHRRPGRHLRRALHDRPRGADRRPPPRGRARRGPSPHVVPGMVEPRRGMMPPVQGQPGRPRPSRRTVVRRRALVALGVVAAAGVGLGALLVIDHGGGSKPATTTVAPPPLRIVFPEGFTRRDMAARITAVRRIAETRRGVTPTMTARGYLAADRALEAPGRVRARRTRAPARGLPLPCHLRLHRRAPPRASSCNDAAAGVSRRTGRSSTSPTRARRT